VTERIEKLHPDPNKSGVNISRAKYNRVREAIISALSDQPELTFSELGGKVNMQLDGQFEGSVEWYFTTVKFDLEARGIIERVGRSSPQRIRLTES
jgi:hypothetical protein